MHCCHVTQIAHCRQMCSNCADAELLCDYECKALTVITCDGHGPGMIGSCLGLFSPRLWLSEGNGSVPGPKKGLAITFSEDTSFPPGFPSKDST